MTQSGHGPSSWCADGTVFRVPVEIAEAQKETAGRSDALSCVGLLLGVTALALVLGFGAGYAVRKRKSRMRRRYYHGD
jgi:hypothetical protein